MITCEKCGASAFEAFVSARTALGSVDQEGNVMLIPGDVFDDPGFIDIEVTCTACGAERLLAEAEWEYM